MASVKHYRNYLPHSMSNGLCSNIIENSFYIYRAMASIKHYRKYLLYISSNSF